MRNTAVHLSVISWLPKIRSMADEWPHLQLTQYKYLITSRHKLIHVPLISISLMSRMIYLMFSAIDVCILTCVPTWVREKNPHLNSDI